MEPYCGTVEGEVWCRIAIVYPFAVPAVSKLRVANWGELQMYVKRLCIKNFRGISDLTVCFQPGVNVIIGENNSHKTTVMDALRLCFQQGDQQRSLYVTKDDFYVARNGNRANDIAFTLRFGGLTDNDKAIFVELLSLGDTGDGDELVLHVRYSISMKHGIERIRTRLFGGDSETPVPQEILELLYVVHLDALRDAKRQLSPNRGNRLGQLFSKLVHEETRQNSYANQLNNAITGCNDWTALIDGARGTINDHLRQTRGITKSCGWTGEKKRRILG